MATGAAHDLPGEKQTVSDNTNRPLRIAHLADTHLGYSAFGKVDPESGRNQRAVDIEQSFQAAVSDILSRNVDLVLHAGDVFHHTRPSWSTMTHFLVEMRRFESAGIPVVVIAGNHDTPRMRATGSVYDFLKHALPGIRFMAGYDTDAIALPKLGVVVHGVPHGALTNPDPPLLLPDEHLRNVVMAHGVAGGALFTGGHEPGEVEIKGNILQSDYDYVALGHIHLRQNVGINAYYSGSTERTSWGDQPVQPGYALVSLGDRGAVPVVEYVDIPARPMETLFPIDGSERTARVLADTILQRAAALDRPEAMVRVELQNTPRPVFRETDRLVRRELNDLAWYIRLTAPGEALDPLGRDAANSLADLHPLTMFEAFVQEKEALGAYDSAFASAFRAKGRQAIESAITRVQETTSGDGAA